MRTTDLAASLQWLRIPAPFIVIAGFFVSVAQGADCQERWGENDHEAHHAPRGRVLNRETAGVP